MPFRCSAMREVFDRPYINHRCIISIAQRTETNNVLSIIRIEPMPAMFRHRIEVDEQIA